MRVLGTTAIIAVGLGLASPAMAQDATAGASIFKKCMVCHVVDKPTNKIGPTLNGVVGRTAGTVADFQAKYSKAMKDAGAGGLVWDEANLAEYITDPKKKVPGNKMVFPGLKKEQEVKDVIAYLKTFPAAQ